MCKGINSGLRRRFLIFRNGDHISREVEKFLDGLQTLKRATDVKSAMDKKHCCREKRLFLQRHGTAFKLLADAFAELLRNEGGRGGLRPNSVLEA